MYVVQAQKCFGFLTYTVRRYETWMARDFNPITNLKVSMLAWMKVQMSVR